MVIAWLFPNSDTLSPMPHVLQQGHTPNSANLYGPCIQTQESLGAIPIQTTTTYSPQWSQMRDLPALISLVPRLWTYALFLPV